MSLFLTGITLMGLGLVDQQTVVALTLGGAALAIAMAAFLGPSLQNAMIAIGLTVTPIFVRLTRGQVLAVKAWDGFAGAKIAKVDRVEWIYIPDAATAAATASSSCPSSSAS